MCYMHQRQIFKQELNFEQNTSSTFKHMCSSTPIKRNKLMRSYAAKRLFSSNQKRQIFESEIKDIVIRSLEKDQNNARILFKEVPQEHTGNKVSQKKRYVHEKNSIKACLKIKPLRLPSAINNVSRVILIDWLSQVAQELFITKEALHLAIFYLDKLAKKITISKKQYQCLGVTCLFISHKFDSRKSLSYSIASDLVQNTIREQTFEEYEQKIMKLLNFKLNHFTLWSQMNMILEGFKHLVCKSISIDWNRLQKEILWITEGWVMSKTYSWKKGHRYNVCLHILSQTLSKNDEYSEIQNKLKIFCCHLDSDFDLEIAISNKEVRYWSQRCSSQLKDINSYHPELKTLVKC